MIRIKDLSIKLGEFSLEDVNLSIGDGEYFIILGPTGAGKTVLLECIAGLHRIKQGEVWLGNDEITHLASEERNIGYVPQDYVLFPFLNVVDNIAFALKQVETGTEVEEVIRKLGFTAQTFYRWKRKYGKRCVIPMFRSRPRSEMVDLETREVGAWEIAGRRASGIASG